MSMSVCLVMEAVNSCVPTPLEASSVPAKVAIPFSLMVSTAVVRYDHRCIAYISVSVMYIFHLKISMSVLEITVVACMPTAPIQLDHTSAPVWLDLREMALTVQVSECKPVDDIDVPLTFHFRHQ